MNHAVTAIQGESPSNSDAV